MKSNPRERDGLRHLVVVLVMVLRQVAFKLHTVQSLDAPLVVRLDKEMLFGVRHVIQNEAVTADVLKRRIECQRRHRRLPRSQDLPVHRSRERLGGERLFWRDRVCANAQAERQYGNQGEAQLFPQPSPS